MATLRKPAGITALVTDDDLIIRTTFCAILEKLQCTPIAVASGQEALGAARRYRPDIIFLDVVMPDADGFQTLAALKQDSVTSEIPVVIVTGRNDAETLIKAIRAGASDFIAKPFLAGDVALKLDFALQDDQQRRKMTADLIQNETALEGGSSREEMRRLFISNFEGIYINLARLMAFREKSALQDVISPLLDVLRFYQLNPLREKVLQMLPLLAAEDWDSCVTILSDIYEVALEYRRSIPVSLP